MAERSFSWTETALGAGVVNVLINAPIGWAIVPVGTSLPLWGLPSVSFDLAATAGGIAFGTVLIVTPQIRAQFRKGQLAPPVVADKLRAWLASLPPSALQRAIHLGVLAVLVFVPLPLVALSLFGVDGVDRLQMAILKGSFAFAVAALITPPIAVAAMLDRPPAAEPG